MKRKNIQAESKRLCTVCECVCENVTVVSCCASEHRNKLEAMSSG